MLGSANITGGKLFHIMSGNLSHQIEHHLFPDIPAARTSRSPPRSRRSARRYGLPYNSGGFSRQLGSVWRKIAKLAVPDSMEDLRRGLRLPFLGGRKKTATPAPVVPDVAADFPRVDVPAQDVDSGLVGAGA